ncbi:MAG: HAD hydrolase family protein, partial [Oscillospiraceae bacterium]|nr:HAD hydrolase family protein [Oscillospiraceae bacterium]
NKGYALKALCRILNISENEVMAFGDSGNDCEMLRTAGYSYATANAWEEAKRAAKNITLSNEDDGVAVQIEKYLENIKE